MNRSLLRAAIGALLLFFSTAAAAQSIDMSITSMTDAPDPITLGTGDVTYTVNINNNTGASTATNVSLTVNVPAAFANIVKGAGRITAYGSVVDQETQDPTFVPAQ